MKIFLLPLLVGLFSGEQDSQKLPFILYDSDRLAEVKRALSTGSVSSCTQTAYERIKNRADELLEVRNPTVMDKTINPPTSDKHDYLSISRYWWPDSTQSDGLPWIRKDGITNPETQTDDVDRKRLGLLTSGVKYLSLAYYFTEDERYAGKAISMLHTWFLSKDTRMNPHLKYAQSVPGNDKGRPFGILDGRMIAADVPDAIVILRKSSLWSAAHEDGMRSWLTAYLDWLTESDLGKEGSMQTNNHGSWYRLHVAALALFLDQPALAKKMVVDARESLEEQLDEEGGQIHELRRTRSFYYSCFNLEPLLMLARIGDQVGVDMWQYTSPNGKSLALALDYLIPVVDGEAWEHPSRGDNKLVRLIPIIHRFAMNDSGKDYRQVLSKAILQLQETNVPDSKLSSVQEACLLDGLDLKVE